MGCSIPLFPTAQPTRPQAGSMACNRTLKIEPTWGCLIQERQTGNLTFFELKFFMVRQGRRLTLSTELLSMPGD